MGQKKKKRHEKGTARVAAQEIVPLEQKVKDLIAEAFDLDKEDIRLDSRFGVDIGRDDDWGLCYYGMTVLFEKEFNLTDEEWDLDTIIKEKCTVGDVVIFIPTTLLMLFPGLEACPSFYVTCGLDGFGSVSILPVRSAFRVCVSSSARWL